MSLLRYRKCNHTCSVKYPIVSDSMSVAASRVELGLVRCLPAFAVVLNSSCLFFAINSLSVIYCLS